MQPLPPLPACTVIGASSTNFIEQYPERHRDGQFSNQGKLCSRLKQKSPAMRGFLFVILF